MAERERRIWRRLGGLLLAALLVAGAGQAWTAMAEQNDSVPSAFPGSITALDLDLEAGSATITGGSENAVTVRQDLNWTLRRPQVQQTVSGHTLRISVHCPAVLGIGQPGCGAALEIRVPPATAVTARITSGQTTVTGLSGDLSLRATSGEVDLNKVSGRIAAKVSSGRIAGTNLTSANVRAEVNSGEVALGFATAPDDVTLISSSGSISANLPPDTHYNLTTHGKADFDPGLVDPQSPHTLRVSAGSGSATLGYRAG